LEFTAADWPPVELAEPLQEVQRSYEWRARTTNPDTTADRLSEKLYKAAASLQPRLSGQSQRSVS